MRYIVFLSCFFLAMNAQAGSITHLQDRIFPTITDSDEMYNGIAPERIAKTQRATAAHIQYMLQNYSLEEMAQYAIRINNNERQIAIDANRTPPARLSQEILQDKEKIAQYLRSRFDWTY